MAETKMVTVTTAQERFMSWASDVGRGRTRTRSSRTIDAELSSSADWWLHQDQSARVPPPGNSVRSAHERTGTGVKS
jgi:hypothetical protein